MKKFNEQVVSGSDAFDTLGISLTDADGNLRSIEDLMNESIIALSGMDEGAERTALATDLFGKAAQELAPTLNGGADSIQALKDRASDLGLVLSDEGVAASAAYSDAMYDLDQAISGVKNDVGAALLPIITDLVNGITDALPGLREFVRENE